MQIDGYSYQTFYLKLQKTLLERCFSEDDRKKFNLNSTGFWTSPSKEFKKGKQLYEIAYADNSLIKGDKYLYNMWSEYSLDFKGFGKINDLAMISCLDIMGYRIPKKITNQSFRDHEQVKVAVAFQFFAENEMRDYFEKHLKDFVVFDHATNSVIESAFIWDRKSYKTLAKEEAKDIVFEITEDEHLRFKANRAIKKFVNGYFELLNSRDFKGAMDFWDSEKRKYYWNDDLQEFHRLYWNKDKIMLKSVILERIDRSRNVYMVYLTYYETISYYTAEDYEIFLRKTAIENSKEVLKSLNSFLSRSDKNRFNIAEMSFQSLFDNSVIDKMHYDAAYDQSRLKKVFPEHNRLSVTRFAECIISDSNELQLKFRSFNNLTMIRDDRYFNE